MGDLLWVGYHNECIELIISPSFYIKVLNIVDEKEGAAMIKKIIMEFIAFMLMIVLFPMYVVLQILFMIIALILWPISKIMINKNDSKNTKQ